MIRISFIWLNWQEMRQTYYVIKWEVFYLSSLYRQRIEEWNKVFWSSEEQTRLKLFFRITIKLKIKNEKFVWTILYGISKVWIRCVFDNTSNIPWWFNWCNETICWKYIIRFIWNILITLHIFSHIFLMVQGELYFCGKANVQ